MGVQMIATKKQLLVLLLMLVGVKASAQLFSKDAGLDCKFVYPIQQALVSQHVQFQNLTPELEKRTIEQFLKRYDPSKIYLLEADRKKLEGELKGIFEKVQKKDCSALRAVQNLLNTRVKERAEFVKKFLGPQYKFDSNTEIRLDRDKLPAPKTVGEAEDYLKKYVHFQISNYLLTETPLEEAKENVKKNWERSVKRSLETREEELLASFLDAFGNSLDPHTSFMARDNNEDFKIQMSLSLQGIGATLSSQDGFTVIENLVPGGPAAKSGLLQVQDKIVAVGQGEEGPMENVVEMDLKEVVKKIRGPKGTKVRLTVLRKSSEGKQTFTITLVRDQIKLEEQAIQLLVETRQIRGKEVKLGIVNLPSFYNDGKRGGRSASSDFIKVIEEAKKQKVAGLVLDLSMNGGGSLDDAVKIAGLFFKKGNVVKQSTKDDPRGLRTTLADEDPAVQWNGPLVILVSRVSASASEIVAGALQDYRRAIIVGSDHTFGKGTVQTVIDIPPYSGELGAIKVTIGTFFIPGGYSTQHRGVFSDILIPNRLDLEDVGEKNLDYSLPPAQIAAFLSPEAYVKTGPDAWSVVTPEVIQSLAQKSKGRIEKNEEFKKIKEDLAKSAKDSGKVLKLSEVLKDEKQKEKVSKKNLSPEEKKQEYLKRPELQESLNILSDYIELQTQAS
jgi:carboxyl-terminal processing protease